MKIRDVGSLVLSVAALIAGTQAFAQQQRVAMYTSTHESDGFQREQAIMARPVTVEWHAIPLRKALEMLGQHAQVRIVYQDAMIDAAGKQVTMQAKQAPFGMVLHSMLGGTALQAVVSGTEVITITEGTPATGGVIAGKIIHAKSKRPVPGASIVLEDGEKVVTNDDGTFRISVSAGEHVLHTQAIGFVRQKKTVVVVDGETVTVEIVMDPSASVLDEVVVTGTVVATARKAIATPITVISGEELEQRGITRIDQLFRGEVPGLVAIERGAASYMGVTEGSGVTVQLYARGSAQLSGGTNPIKTYIDGVELLDPSYLGTIDPRSIEKIEIVTGPQAATIYGSGAMGGVMQIFTKRGGNQRTPELKLSVRYGVLENSFSNGRTPEHHDVLSLSGGLGAGFSYSGNVSYDYIGQWQPKMFNRRFGGSIGGTHTDGRLTLGGSFATTGTAQGSFNSRLGGATYGIYRMLAGPNAVAAENYTSDLYAIPRTSMTSNQTMSANASYRVSSVWQHHITLGRSQNVMTLKPSRPNFSSPLGGDTLMQTRRSSGQRFTWNYNTSYRGAPSWISSSLTAGMNGSMGEIVTLQGCQQNSVATLLIGCVTGGNPLVWLPMNDRSWGGFAQWQAGLFGRLYTTMGLRVERNPNYGEKVKFDFTPTNGITYTIEHGIVSLKLMGSYGRATRPPTADQRREAIVRQTGWDINEYIQCFANPDLRPERSRGPQGGIELYLGNLGSLTVNHYQQTVTDLIQRVVVDSIQLRWLASDFTAWVSQEQWMNVAKIRQRGWEGTGGVNLGPVSFKGTYSWNDSRVLEVHARSIGVQYQPGAAFRGIPTHTGSASVSYANGPTTLLVTTNFIGAKNTLDRTERWWVARYDRTPYGDIAASKMSGTPITEWRMPGYAKTNVSGSHRVHDNLTVTLNITNLANSFTSDVGVMNPTLGRQTTVGVSYRFDRR